jgi:hypothetical protein
MTAPLRSIFAYAAVELCDCYQIAARTSFVLSSAGVNDAQTSALRLDTEGEYEPGFIDSIKANFEVDRALVRERLQQERCPKMLRAAVEAMIEIRRTGKTVDSWSIAELKIKTARAEILRAKDCRLRAGRR